MPGPGNAPLPPNTHLDINFPVERFARRRLITTGRAPPRLGVTSVFDTAPWLQQQKQEAGLTYQRAMRLLEEREDAAAVLVDHAGFQPREHARLREKSAAGPAAPPQTKPRPRPRTEARGLAVLPSLLGRLLGRN